MAARYKKLTFWTSFSSTNGMVELFGRSTDVGVIEIAFFQDAHAIRSLRSLRSQRSRLLFTTARC